MKAFINCLIISTICLVSSAGLAEDLIQSGSKPGKNTKTADEKWVVEENENSRAAEVVEKARTNAAKAPKYKTKKDSSNRFGTKSVREKKSTAPNSEQNEIAAGEEIKPKDSEDVMEHVGGIIEYMRKTKVAVPAKEPLPKK